MNFIESDDLESFYLRRIVVARIMLLTRSLEKNRRYFGDSDDDVLIQKKIGNLENEFSVLTTVLNNLNRAIALSSMRDDAAFRE